MAEAEIVTAIVLELADEFEPRPFRNYFSDRRVVLFALKKYTTPFTPSQHLIDLCMDKLLGPDFEYR